VTTLLTLADLRKARVCDMTVNTFSELFGETVEAASEDEAVAKALAVADRFSWADAASKLLRAEARRAYAAALVDANRAYAAALAEPRRAYDVALVEALRACDVATAEALRACDAALDEPRRAYAAAAAEAFARALWQQEAA